MMNEWIISASLLIAAVLAVRFALRGRISLRVQYALWAVVLVRLLLPIQIFTSDFGAGSIARDVDISAPVRQVYVSANEDRYERAYDDAVRQVTAQYVGVSEFVELETIENEARDIARQNMELDLKQILYHLWFAGMVVMTSVIVSCNIHLSLQLRRRRWEFPIAHSLLPVYVTEAVPTPCIFGLFHPAIYLTPEAAQDEQVRTHVLAHELTHYRHWDHVWSVLRSLCLVLHWYNPLVWIAARVSRADAELACDEGALAKLGEDHRGDYGRTLIGLTCADHGGSMFVTATTMTGSAGSIRERIKLLMKRPRNTILTLTAVILMVTLIVGCTFAGAPEPVETKPTQELEAQDFWKDGELVYPGTFWNMTPEQLKAALEITEEDILDERQFSTGDNDYDVYSSHDLVIQDTFLDHPVEITFMFHGYTPDAVPGLYQIYMELGQLDLASMTQELSDILDEGQESTFGAIWTSGKSEIQLTDIVFDYDGILLSFHSDLTREMQIGAETGHSPDNDMSYEGHELPIPDDPVSTDLIYAPAMEQAMAEYADKNPQELGEKDLNAFRAAFRTLREDDSVNPAACFLVPYYGDITEMSGRDFLAYFPADADGTQEEFELLKAKYPEFFGNWTWDTMPIPIHRYDAKNIDDVVSRYGNIPWAELDEGVHYLEETGSYYNYTSDFGLGGFYARGGFTYDGGAVVYSDFSALFFTETEGRYLIQAHLPTLATAAHSSQPMIPAELSDEDAIAAVVDAFFVAYEENQYLCADNDYDHLTIIAADPERTVTHQGKSVPLSAFHGSIEYLHGKEAYWKHVRQDQGIARHGFAVSTRVNDIRYEGDTAVVQAGVGVTFTYTDSTAPSGMGKSCELLMVLVDGEWLIADVTELNDWFDAENKNDPNFDPEALIASYIP